MISDDYEPGDDCPAGDDFFSNCKICICNDEGNDAECNDNVCKKYYPKVKLH